MPKAVVHVLFAIILLDLIRNYLIKDKKNMPLHYVFLGGVAGLLPDADVPVFWFVRHVLGIQVEWFHRHFTHTIFFPLVFLFVALAVMLWSKDKKHWTLFAVLAFGVSLHLLLDGIFTGGLPLFYPFSALEYGFALGGPFAWEAFFEGFDAVVLLVWLWDLDRRHKLRDFM